MSLHAKSVQPRPRSLPDHTADVMNAAKWLFGETENPTRLGEVWLRFFRLESEAWGKFQPNLLASAAFHDLGKASSSFQNCILSRDDQLIRHEHLSALLLCVDPMQVWLRTRSDLDEDLILSAVLTHHLKARRFEDVAPVPVSGSGFFLLTNNPDYGTLFELIRDRLSLGGPIPMLPAIWSFVDQSGTQPVEPIRQKLNRRLTDFSRKLKKEPTLTRLNRAVRAGLIVADAAASGLYREGHEIQKWLGDIFGMQPLERVDIEEKVIEPRIREIAKRRKAAFEWNEFQKLCEQLPERALLTEPCGSGKTLAAYRWIAARLAERPAIRVIFLYPTRATATEGFRDYVSWAPETEAGLMHGTAEYDLEGMFQTPIAPGDDRHTKEFEVEQRLFALGFWTKRIFSATVDQFLAFMQQDYGPLCMLPVLADSVVVIDEVHSFDSAMFSALRSFLREFDVPVLCMTATLSGERREQLISEGLQPPTQERPEDLRKVADLPRYRIRRLDPEQRSAIPERIRKAIDAGRRVLWVVNQVKRAQQAVCDLRQDWPIGTPLLCYHSRFKLKDRRDRHEEVIRMFKQASGPVLAVTTQVCEMSLDLDADLLVTECCPISSLIQRMGRCNRASETRPMAGEILVYPAENHLPYDEKDLAGVKAFLTELHSMSDMNDTSQSRLEVGMAKHGPDLREPLRHCSFIEPSPYAQGGEFRDIDEFTISAVLDSEVEEFKRLTRTRDPNAAGLVVPVPRRPWAQFRGQSGLPRHLTIADERYYDPLTGFWDTPIR